jgi:hypothetical protein
MASAEQTGLVKMDMRFHKTGHHEPAAQILCRAASLGQRRLNGDEATVPDADIDRLILVTGNPGVAKHKIEGHEISFSAAGA